jgi:peptidyl-prolyl cis-trans isomerase B (cyclophilin B)
VLSVLSLFCCGFILGIPGVICGHLALSKLQKEPQLQGKGLAIAGLVIGYVAIAFWLIYVVFFGGLAAIRDLTQGSR